MKKDEVLIEDIDLKDQRFRISPFFSVDRLLLSIKEAGLINPPLVTSRRGKLLLVSGWKRVLACKKLSFVTVPVRMVKGEDDLQTFLLAFYDNLATREFSLLEKAEILRRLKRFGEKESTIIRNYFPLLSIPRTSYYLQLYLTISRFPKEVKLFIHQKNMSIASLEYFAQFSPRERKLLLPLLQPLGQNKQRELLEDLGGISLRDDVAAENVLMEEKMVRIRRSEKLSPLQKSDRIRRMLRKRRYPRLSSRREAFRKALEMSGCPQDISIQPSPYFEEQEMTLRFRFRDREEFWSHLRNLQKLSSKKEFSKVFKRAQDE